MFNQLTARTTSKLLVLSLMLWMITAMSCAQTVDVPQPAPWADAGDDQLRQWTGQALVIGLDGRASCDPLGEVIEVYDWRIFSQPDNSDIQLLRADSVHPSFVAEHPGTYILTLEVLVGEHWSDPDPINIVVSNEISEDFAPSVSGQDRCGNTVFE